MAKSMKKIEIEHTIRAIETLFSIKKIKEKIIIIGSQSLYGQIKEAELIKSVHISKEIDILFEKEENADFITSILGELSQFDRTYHYYVDGIYIKNIKLAKNYKNRLSNLKLSNGRIVQTLNMHDYIVCKLFANREKDRLLINELCFMRNIKMDKNRLLKIVEEYPEDNKDLINFVKNRINYELNFKT